VILEFARSQTYEPATNVKGDDLEPWLFLLPRLDVTRVVAVSAECRTVDALEDLGLRVEVTRDVVAALRQPAELLYLDARAVRSAARSDASLTAIARLVADGGTAVLAASAATSSAARVFTAATNTSTVVRIAAAATAVRPTNRRVVAGAAWTVPTKPSRRRKPWERFVRPLRARFGRSPHGSTLVAVDEVTEAPVTLDPSHVLVLRGDAHEPTSVPRYLAETASRHGYSLGRGPWVLEPSRGYRSQKIVFHLPETGEIVKITQHPRFNARLDNEYRALAALAHTAPAGLAPQPRFRGLHARLLVIGQSRLLGAPFRTASTGSPTCGVAEAAVDALLDLARLGVGTPSGSEAAAALHQLLAQHERVHRPPPEQLAFLRAQIDLIGAAGAQFPAVFSHGDPTTLNALVRDDGGIGLVDWENGEPLGLPFFDIFYFVNAYAQWSFERRRRRWTPGAIWATLYEPTGFRELLERSLSRYRDAVEITADLAGPSMFMFWMTLALREATRSGNTTPATGTYARLLADLVRKAAHPHVRVVAA
jgi:hypothetical protein